MSNLRAFRGLVGSQPAHRRLRALRTQVRAARAQRANEAGVNYSATKPPRRGVRRGA